MQDASHLRDRRFMLRAVALANTGLGSTYPNPAVGAVVVSEGGELVGAAHSDRTGGAHAEVRALAQAGAAAVRATLYVTLEPCSHLGRTGRCTDAILAARVARVVVGIEDPAAHANGRGLGLLAEAGVAIDRGVLAKACGMVHEHYLHHVRTGLPFVTLKVASSLDGRIAVASGQSRWITGPIARRHAHRLRARHHAIAVGIDTVLTDDPRLDVRHVRGVSPQPVVFDSRLRLGTADAVEHRIVAARPIVFHGRVESGAGAARLRERGAQLVELPTDAAGRIELGAALRWLGARDFRSVLVEGGARLLGSFVAQSAWQRLYAYQAPVLLGEGVPMFAGLAFDDVRGAPRIRVERRRMLGDDQLSVAVLA